MLITIDNVKHEQLVEYVMLDRSDDPHSVQFRLLVDC